MMTFDHVMTMLNRGSQMTRRSWQKGRWLSRRSNQILEHLPSGDAGFARQWQPTHDDLVAEDWVIY